MAADDVRDELAQATVADPMGTFSAVVVDQATAELRRLYAVERAVAAAVDELRGYSEALQASRVVVSPTTAARLDGMRGGLNHAADRIAAALTARAEAADGGTT